MSNKLKIVSDNKIPFLQGVLEPYVDVVYLPPSEIKKENVKDADALLIRTRTKCDEKLLDGTNVKFIATATIGYDHINTSYCEERKIKWINAPGCNSSSVMQYIASVLLTIAKKKKINLSETTIGIIGVGNVGSKVALLAKIFGMKILLSDPPRERIEGKKDFVTLEELISASNIITFHVPLNYEGSDKTYHLADESFFGKLTGEKIIFNTSRGEVVKTSSLMDAIKNGIISNCVLDVWENEPEINGGLLNMADIATPHIAGYSADGKANGTAMCVRELNSFFNLGMNKNWYPENIPVPSSKTELLIDCNGKSKQEILGEAILSTYDVTKDDEKLRSSVQTFEIQRGNYHVRREFPFYKIKLLNADDEIKNSIADLGFQLIVN